MIEGQDCKSVISLINEKKGKIRVLNQNVIISETKFIYVFVHNDTILTEYWPVPSQKANNV